MYCFDTTLITNVLKRIAMQERLEHPNVLHYDEIVEDLRVFLWPVNANGIRVTPDDLHDFKAPGFQLPCYMCTVPDLDGNCRRYTPSIIYMSFRAEEFGNYMQKIYAVTQSA
ncbi:hypothetical protein DXG01_014083 [Tephrocybe rancida]|nr:hypothetical protein DXG01_014083 [Tephrocybe rancida]